MKPLNLISAVWRKEVVDNLRDRRTLLAALFYPLLGPLMLVMLMGVIGRSVSGQRERPLELPIVGAEHAPSLVLFLEQNGAKIEAAPDDPEAAVRAGDFDFVLVIPADYGEEFTAGQPATVQLILDDSRESATVAIARIHNLLEGYGRRVGALRLLARGINPRIVNSIAVETQSVATAQSHAARFLGMAPYFIIFSIFIGGMYLAIDTTAGERERGSLEPLLINPLPRWQLVFGKYGAVLVFTLVAVAETLLAFYVVLNLIPLERYLGVRYSLDGMALFKIFLITIPMTLLAAGLQMVIATFTRSFKEAQNYLSMLPLIPALPGIFLVFLPVKQKLWMMLIPTFGQQLLINRVMRGEVVDPIDVATSAAVTIVVAALLLSLAVSLYRREKILFSA